MKKVIEKILIIIFIILLSLGFIVVGSGYNLYKEAIEETSLEKKVEEIKDKDNYTTLDEMPDIYKKAVVAVEDHRFYEHGGIDVIAIGRALWNDLKAMSFVEGGSTITQQLAKNIYFTQEKELTRKVAEVFMAYKIEDNLEKDEILELYLNTSYFGDGYETVKEASRGYFEKEPMELTDYEAVMLAGIPNAPSVYAPTVNMDLSKQRANQVIEAMTKYKIIDNEGANKLLKDGKEYSLKFN